MKKLTFILLIGSTSALFAESGYNSYQQGYQNYPNSESNWSMQNGPRYQQQQGYGQGQGYQGQGYQGYNGNQAYDQQNQRVQRQQGYNQGYQQQSYNPRMDQQQQSYNQRNQGYQQQQSYNQRNQGYQQQDYNQENGKTSYEMKVSFPEGYQNPAQSTQQNKLSSNQRNQFMPGRQQPQNGWMTPSNGNIVQGYRNMNQNQNQRSMDSYTSWQGNQSVTHMGNDHDQELAKKVHNALSGWFTTTYDNVTFDVDNGIVTLRGTIDTNEDKQKAEEAIRRIQGVRQVNNQIAVSAQQNSKDSKDSSNQKYQNKYPQDFGATEADRQLNYRIRDKLSGGWFTKGYDALIIKTDRGVVVITGVVDRNSDIQNINDKIKDIPGIRTVDNQVQAKTR